MQPVEHSQPGARPQFPVWLAALLVFGALVMIGGGVMFAYQGLRLQQETDKMLHDLGRDVNR